MNVFRLPPVSTPSLISNAPAARASGFGSLTLSYGSNSLTDSSYLRPGLIRNRAAHRFGLVRLPPSVSWSFTVCRLVDGKITYVHRRMWRADPTDFEDIAKGGGWSPARHGVFVDHSQDQGR